MKAIMNRKITLMVLILVLCSVGLAAEELIQVGILLDTSSSMDGLIDQAKSQLWKIVNELALAKRNGKSPAIEVALYEYGNDNLSAHNGYIRQVLPLTSDLDKVSESLFALTTNGGSEYCGTVIGRATTELAWKPENDVLKVIFIAGNEEFTQGGIDFRVTCKNAIAKGIIVNTIFCGDFGEGVRTFWQAGAELADGSYLSINQDAVVSYIKAPQDDEIIALNNELNKTYLAYGKEGEAGKVRQEAQDNNAAGVSEESFVQRSISKSKAQYSNESWDLVDAVASGAVDLPSIPQAALPEELKGKTDDEKKAYLDAMSAKREGIQKRINSLENERRGFIENERKKMNTENTLDEAMISTVHKQALEKNYQFGE